MSDNAGYALWGIGALVLAVSSLAAHRMSFSFVVKSALAWAAIIFVVVLAVSHRYEMQAVLSSFNQALGIEEQQVTGGAVRIRMSADGHFWARATINGQEQLMMIDTGATITALTAETAERVGVKPDGRTTPLSTANGMVEAQQGRIETFEIGPLKTKDMGAVISPAFGDLNVVGMNFLSRLGSWRVEGRTLILEPGKGDSTPPADVD